jgi:nitrite reductase/ring-hydroxylating ferredoxin subunit
MSSNELVLDGAAERWDAGPADAIAEGDRLVVDVGKRTVGIFRVDNRYYAYENVCPHQGGPVCQGLRIDRVIELLDGDRVARGLAFDETEPHIVCPWHGYEFSVRTGRHPGAAEIRLMPVAIEEVDGRLYLRV